MTQLRGVQLSLGVGLLDINMLVQRRPRGGRTDFDVTLSDGAAVRAGYLRSMTPVPDRNYDLAFPDADVNVLSVGAG